MINLCRRVATIWNRHAIHSKYFDLSSYVVGCCIFFEKIRARSRSLQQGQ